MENYTVEQMISLSWVMLNEEWQERGPTKHFLHEFIEEFSLVQQLQIKDVLIVLAIAVLFTIHRFFTTIFFIKVCFLSYIPVFVISLRKCSNNNCGKFIFQKKKKKRCCTAKICCGLPCFHYE